MKKTFTGTPLCAIRWSKSGIAGGFREVEKNAFQRCFQKLYERRQKSIVIPGNYFKDGFFSVLWTIQCNIFYTLSLNFMIILHINSSLNFKDIFFCVVSKDKDTYFGVFWEKVFEKYLFSCEKVFYIFVCD